MEIDHFQPMLKESIERFLTDFRRGATDFSDMSFIFSRLLQNLPDPSLDYVWFHTALSFYATKFTQSPSSDHQFFSSANLFELLVSSSGSCMSLDKRVSVLCPLIYHLYHLDFRNGDGAVKRDFECLLDGVISYICLACGGQGLDDGILSLNLSPSFVDLVHVWVVDKVDENSEFRDELNLFLPLVSHRIRSKVGVGCKLDYLAGVVMCEAFLLRLCSKFGSSMSRNELEKQLRDCVLQIMNGFHSFYFFDILLEMLLEPGLPVTPKLNPEDVPLLQEVLSDAAVTADYSFITHQRRFNLPCKSIRSLALRWLLVAHNALESARKIGHQVKIYTCIDAYSKSCIPSLLIEWVTTQTTTDERISLADVPNPLHLVEWLLTAEDQGTKVFDCESLKTYAKSILCNGEYNRCPQIIKSNNNDLNEGILFHHEDEGRNGDKVDSGLDMVDYGENEFQSVPKLMKPSVTNVTRKRKEGTNFESEIPVKFLKYYSHDSSTSDMLSPTGNDDGLGSGSEVDNPVSDEDMEDMKH